MGSLRILVTQAKGAANDVGKGLNPSSSNPPAMGGAAQTDNASGNVGKGLNPNSSNLPDPSAAADKASGNAKGLAADVKQGAKNVASDLSENPLDGLADKVGVADGP